MKRIAVLSFAFLMAVPVFAQTRFFDLGLNAVWVDPNSSGTFNSPNANQPLNIDFNGKLGYGASANVFLGSNVSLEIAASEVRPDARYGIPGATANQGHLKMIPITGVLQYHFSPKGFIDPYVGAGGAYVLFDNVSNVTDVGGIGLRQLNFKDDVGFAVNGGLGFNFSPRIGLNADVKYVPLKSSATAVFAAGPDRSAKVKINPVIASAGIVFHF